MSSSNTVGFNKLMCELIAQDDEFDIQLDDDSPAEALEAQAAPAQAESKAQQPDKQQQQPAQHMVSGPHRYVRPGLEQPSLASSGPGLPSPGKQSFSCFNSFSIMTCAIL